MARGRSDRSQSASTLRLRRLASAAAATEVRLVLRAWADALGVAADLCGVIELACYEALANVACHAYAGRSVGTMVLDATYDHTLAGSPRMTVTVSDQGHWQTPAVRPGPSRGRGIRMIRSLSGAADISESDTGTTVRMSWDLSLTPAMAS